ncbi:molybdopterin-synthase adenylyltransferase MoeB [Jeongeupia naejangsanensis]|uniref:Molybdopterin-synthase adenylyltransferase MoeB n=1 Tax=Jeongeupia naejangsanensis TaxID=613195 RepID=A0ABS2BN54_9NEIS|nr:molybdopterin-synthase adenylyltransferase MoeB [Jeongeupia naejangsanensis]MBM3117039.1 molybdopterin-synthase adenylyltransferase MoeB [Jeongeupia naejangsanensis]
MSYEQRAVHLRAAIPEIPAEQVLDMLRHDDAVLIDVRDAEEVKGGLPEPAQHLARGQLELNIHHLVDDVHRPIAVMCASGLRSLFAAESLINLGYTKVFSVRGGFKQWKDAGLPTRVPQQLSVFDRERYSRHLLIPEVGEKGQLRLKSSRVLLLGAGGLGSPVALYLAAAGVGTLGIVDPDVVESSNLQRQVIHGEDQLGKLKVDSAEAAIHRLNSQIKVIKHPVLLDESNALSLLQDYDLVVDGSDNFKARYLVNDACVKLGIPNVHGAIYRFEGYVTTFAASDEAPCYRCMYPELPPPEMAPSCAEAGVLGVLPGVIGLLQAVEVIKLLLGIGRNLSGKMLRVDALNNEFSMLDIDKAEQCLCSHHRDEIQIKPIEAFACAI